MMPPARGTRTPAAPKPVPVRLPINLGQFLKVAQLASSGGEAKTLIAAGAVSVNGRPETRRGHRLSPGDVVRVGDAEARAVAGGDSQNGSPVDGPADAVPTSGSS